MKIPWKILAGLQQEPRLVFSNILLSPQYGSFRVVPIGRNTGRAKNLNGVLIALSPSTAERPPAEMFLGERRRSTGPASSSSGLNPFQEREEAHSARSLPLLWSAQPPALSFRGRGERGVIPIRMRYSSWSLSCAACLFGWGRETKEVTPIRDYLILSIT